MPTYGYRCPDNHTFERLQKITDPPITECEVCGKPVKKILYPVGISFKGSGFYVNDYAPSGETAKRKSDSEPAPTATTTETKTDAKPEAKTDTKTESAPATPAPAASTTSAKSE
ncbi:MAG: hypothetical protein H7Y38_02110 [Armatimonadetes bacterium]|nr:hypothetical protein [Armatimonadota bacterium]